MKRYLVENSGYVHTVLALIWFIPMMACFMVGTTIFNDAIWMPLCALIAIILQIAFAIVESDWQQQILTRSGYNYRRPNLRLMPKEEIDRMRVHAYDYVDIDDEHYHRRP